MVAQEISVAVKSAFTLEERRAFLKLSLEERRRLLAEQVEHAIEDYNSEQASKEREEWQGGDLVDL
ncbi:MAG TPA: hypothetical protein PLD20_21575 [Blastocatellia bacterium]|nr:hypothetical protein [Blastocatellia bacterium]HMV87860.1 hypothetical protein [Blastocatellia bacterium]HMX29403.1 hypothetical protein [Blastocatellia bacterium]HMZ20543.1 hypothetical protein [Blastocatellia bacterium]HNG32866.1 hypothetical protein [Blastocatellia bacterium]